MRLKLNDLSTSVLSLSTASAVRGALLWVVTALAATACNHSGTDAVNAGTMGLSLSPLSGNSQVAEPQYVYTYPLVLQTLDAQAQIPMAYVVVDFTVTTPGSDATILIPESVSDANGMVQTKVRAPSAYGQTITVQAQIQGTNITSTFQLTTNALGTATQYIADTTHHDAEIAGVPFGFIIRVADQFGNTVTNYNQTQSMVIRFDTSSSWTGVAPTLPATGYVCSFVNGICTTPSVYTLTDARTVTKMYVGDPTDSLQAEYYKSIAVSANVRNQLVIANIAGGPTAGAVPYPSNVHFNADQGLAGATQSFSAAVCDLVGNYIEDPDAVNWTASAQLPVLVPTWAAQNSLNTSGITGTINPKVVGSALLTVGYTGTHGAITAGADQIYVDPGPDRTKWHMLALTQHMNAGTLFATENAGESFSISLRAVDSQGNSLVGSSTNNYADDFTGNFSVNLSFTGGPVGGRGAFKNSVCTNAIEQVFGSTDLSNFANTAAVAPVPIATSVCQAAQNRESVTMMIPFVKGQPNTGTVQLRGILNWATVANGLPNIRILADMQVVQNGFPALNNGLGAGPITVPTGSPAAINLWTGPGGFAAGQKPLCERTRLEIALPPAATLSGNSSTALFNCPALTRATSGDPASTYYPVLEDRGGNWVADVPSTFTGALTTATEWTTNGGGASGTFLPIIAASDTIAVASNAKVNVLQDDGVTVDSQFLTTSFGEVVAPLPLDHFVLVATDTGTPVPLPQDTISVLRPYTLKVLAYDVNNNFLNLLGGNYVFTFPVPTGSGASPKGTAAVVPPSGTYTFINGTASINNAMGNPYQLLQPLYQNITIQMTSGPYSAQPLTVQVNAGPIASIAIRDTANGGGSDLSTLAPPITMADSQTQNFFAAGYDLEGNYLTPALASWTSASGNLFTLTSPTLTSPVTAPSITYTPVLLGSGVISLTASGFTVSTGTVTVIPGVADHISVTNAAGPGSPGAGQSFPVAVQIQDVRNNPIAYTGNLTLSIQVSETATLEGLSFTSSVAPQGSGPQPYHFTNGVLDTNHTFTLYNSGSPGLISYAVTSGPAAITALVPATLSVTPASAAAYQVWIQNPASTMAAGSTASYFAYMVDQYGNTVTSYPSSAVTVSLLAPTADQKITLLNSVVTNAQSVVGTMNAGVASFSVTGTQSGTLSPTATVAGGPGNPAHLNPITVLAGTPTTLAWTTNTSSTYAAGTGLGVALSIEDTYGNVITTGANSTATVTLSLYQSGSAAPGKQIGSWAMSASSGVATFAGGTVLARPYLTSPGAGYTVQATASTAPGVSVGNSTTFSVTAASDYQLAFGTQPTAGSCVANGTTFTSAQCAGVAFSTQPVVKIQDQYGNTSSTTGAAIYLTPYTSSNCAAGTVGDTAAMMPGSNPTATSSSGTATFSGVGYQVADSTSGGPVYLQASSTGLTSICSNSVLVKPAQANAPTYVNGTMLSAGTVGQTYNSTNQQPQFKIVDSFSNGVPNYTVNFAWNTVSAGQAVTASATTNSSGIAQPTSFTLQNSIGASCSAGSNYIVASTTPNIGSANAAAISLAPTTPTNITFSTQPQTGVSNQGQTLNTGIQSQPVLQLRDQYNNCAYNVANGSDTFTASLYTTNTCATAAGGTLGGNTATISSGQGAFTTLQASAVTTIGTGYYLGVTDTNGFTTCGTHALRFYNPISPIYFNTVGVTTVTTPATTGSVLLIVDNGVPLSYTFGVNSAGSQSANCTTTPTVTVAFTGGACPGGYTCSTYTPGCLGNNSNDQVYGYDGSGTYTANNIQYANITVSGAYLSWSVSTPTSWGSFSSATTTTYTLKNIGNGATGTGLTAAFSADSHFSISSDNCSGVSLAAGTTCTIVIKFDPTAAPALLSGQNRTGSVYYYSAPGGQTSAINFNASKL